MKTKPKVRLVACTSLEVGDMWPQPQMRHHGPIVAIHPYDGPFRYHGVAELADGLRISIPDVVPVECDR